MGYFWLLLATCGLSEDIMSFPEEGRTLLVDSSKVMSVSFDGTWSGTFGGYMEVPTESTVHLHEVPGHYVVLGGETKMGEPLALPFVIEFTNDMPDVIAIALKKTGSNAYVLGITVDTLISWERPSKKLLVEDEKYLSLYKLPMLHVKKVNKLVNTESHKLADMLDVFLGYLNWAKAASIKAWTGTNPR